MPPSSNNGRKGSSPRRSRALIPERRAFVSGKWSQIKKCIYEHPNDKDSVPTSR